MKRKDEKVMTDQEKAVQYILDFLDDETKRILLVKGYDGDAKIKAILYCLNEKFNRGIIRTGGNVSDFPLLINSAFREKVLPYNIVSTSIYDIGNMQVNINSYSNHTKKNPRGNDGTFTLFYPVQTVLDDPKRYSKFLSELENTCSSKIILATTIEWSIENWDIENHVDEVYFYDVENDNPEIMTNLRNNGAI